MGKKRAKKTADSPPMQPKNASPTASGRFIAVGLLVLGAGIFLYALNQEAPSTRSHDHGQTAATSPGQSHGYRYFANADDARPFPVTLSPSRFQSPAIANAYAIAQEIPEVLVQQPCLCGCDNPSDDHRSLLDCYVDEHAATCMVCVKEAVFAKQMTDAGKSGAWIRDAIVRHEFSDVNLGS